MDKLVHFSVGNVSASVARLLGAPKWMALSLALSLGVGKEVRDRARGGSFDAWDAVATTAGGALGMHTPTWRQLRTRQPAHRGYQCDRIYVGDGFVERCVPLVASLSLPQVPQVPQVPSGRGRDGIGEGRYASAPQPARRNAQGCMRLKHQQIVSALSGVTQLINARLTVSDEKDAKSLHFPFKVQYRLGRMADALQRAATLIERTKFAKALDATPGVREAATPIQQGLQNEAALEYLDESVEFDDPWVKPIKLSELGVPYERLAAAGTNAAVWVRDLGPLFECDVEFDAK